MNKKLYALLSAVVMTIGLQGQAQQTEQLNAALQQAQDLLDEALLQNAAQQTYNYILNVPNLPAEEINAKVQGFLNTLPQQAAGLQVSPELIQLVRTVVNELALILVPLIKQTNFNALLSDANIANAGTLGRAAINNPQQLLDLLTKAYTITQSQLPQSVKNILIANPSIAGDAGLLDTLKRVIESNTPSDKQAVAALQLLANAVGDALGKIYVNRNNLNNVNFINEFNALQNLALQNLGVLLTFALANSDKAVRIFEKAKLVKTDDLLQLIRTARTALGNKDLTQGHGFILPVQKYVE